MLRIGPVVKAFQERTQKSIFDWLEENAASITLIDAAYEIGYSDPKTFRLWLKRHMPDLKFMKRPTAIPDASRASGIPQSVIRGRMRRGESLEKAISRPVQERKDWYAGPKRPNS